MNDMTNETNKSTMPWRLIGWGGAIALLAVPLVAMQFTSEVVWTPSDFLFAATMFGIVGGTFDVAVHMSRNLAYRAGAALGLLAGLLLVWVNGAVGFLGDEGNPWNLLFALVLLVAVIGSAIGRYRAAGMARAMAAAAAVQVGIGVAALAAGLGSAGPAGLYEAVLGTSLFTGLWLLSAGLFLKAARDGFGDPVQ